MEEALATGWYSWFQTHGRELRWEPFAKIPLHVGDSVIVGNIHAALDFCHLPPNGQIEI